MGRWTFSHFPRVSVVTDTPPHQALTEGLSARQMLPISVVLHQNHPMGTTTTTQIITTKEKKSFS